MDSGVDIENGQKKQTIATTIDTACNSSSNLLAPPCNSSSSLLAPVASGSATQYNTTANPTAPPHDHIVMSKYLNIPIIVVQGQTN